MDEPTIDEIRRVRRLISAQIGNDLAGLVDRYAKIERQFLKPAITKGTRRNRVRAAIADRSPHTTTACGSAPGGSTKLSKLGPE